MQLLDKWLLSLFGLFKASDACMQPLTSGNTQAVLEAVTDPQCWKIKAWNFYLGYQFPWTLGGGRDMPCDSADPFGSTLLACRPWGCDSKPQMTWLDYWSISWTLSDSEPWSGSIQSIGRVNPRRNICTSRSRDVSPVFRPLSSGSLSQCVQAASEARLPVGVWYAHDENKKFGYLIQPPTAVQF